MHKMIELTIFDSDMEIIRHEVLPLDQLKQSVIQEALKDNQRITINTLQGTLPFKHRYAPQGGLTWNG